jgi:type II secretory pathway component PulJ
MLKLKNKNFISDATGTSLLEIIVAVALFTVIMLSATQIFKMIAESQRNALAAGNVQDNIRFAFEVISKEIRDAQRSDGSCFSLSGENKIFNLDGDDLYFMNKDSQCVMYELDNGRLKITRGSDAGYITPDEIEITNLNFQIKDELSSYAGFPGSQALVVINLDAENANAGIKQNIKMQTAVSARYYE